MEVLAPGPLAHGQHDVHMEETAGRERCVPHLEQTIVKEKEHSQDKSQNMFSQVSCPRQRP